MASLEGRWIIVLKKWYGKDRIHDLVARELLDVFVKYEMEQGGDNELPSMPEGKDEGSNRR